MTRFAAGSSRLRARKRRRFLMLCGAALACALAVFGLSWWLSNAAFLHITSVEISGENIVPESSISDAANHDLRGAYAGLFSKSNIFLYPKVGIRSDLLALYPTLASAAVSAKDFHTIRITVSERSPVALWCGVGEENNCFLLDEDGVAYANAPGSSAQVFRTYYGALPQGPLPRQFLSAAQFRSLSALADAFAKKTSSPVRQVSIDGNDDARMTFADGYDVLFSLKDDTGSVLDRFTLALSAEPLRSHQLSEFEYIDLRFGDKVYYRLKTQ